MNLSRPLQCVTPTVDGDVLHALAVADAWFTAPRLHAVIGRWSQDGVRKSLRRLADQGVVDAESAGQAVLYRLNDEHLAAGWVRALANMRQQLVARLQEAVAGWSPQPVYMALFGSVTGNTMTSMSDIDVFVVSPELDETSAWEDQMVELELAAGRWTGNDLRVVQFSESELAGPVGRQGSVLGDVLSVGITIVGDPDHVLRQMRAA